jgi:hypothetical protein
VVLSVMVAKTPYFSSRCPACGGRVEDTASVWKFGASLSCVRCGASLEVKANWRMLLGLAYGFIATYLGRFVFIWNEANLEPDSISLKLADAAVAFAIAIPAVILLFRGAVYVRKGAKPEPQSHKRDA